MPVLLAISFASEVLFLEHDGDPHIVQPLPKLAQGRIGESWLHMHGQLGSMLPDDLLERSPAPQQSIEGSLDLLQSPATASE
jgi:hypothetical protein